MSQTTVTFTARDTSEFFTLDEINAYFTSIATILAGKMDRRGGLMLADLLIRDGGIINVPPARNVGDLVGTL